MTAASIIIVGDGLAGLASAQHLLGSGVPGADILVLAPEAEDAKASDAPCAICHPFPGQSFQLRPHVLDAFAAAERFLSQSPPHLRRRGRAQRWLSEAHGQRSRLLKSYDRIQPHLSGAVRVNKQNPSSPHPKNVSEIFEIAPAWVANLKGICDWKREGLRQRGIQFESGILQRLRKEDGKWSINDGAIEGEKVILALGAGLPSFFPALPHQKVWGHLVRGERINPEMDIVIGDGHLTSMDHFLWGGASFLPQQEKPHGQQEQEAIDALKAKMTVLSGRDYTVTDKWGGARLVMGHERLPVAGEIPGLDSCFVIGGAGANGLLWLPYLSERLTQELQTRQEIIPEAFQHNRYDWDCWRPDRQKIRS